MEISNTIRAIEDYPIEGVTFRDITTLLKDKVAYKSAIDQMVEAVAHLKIDKVVGIEARGFIVGAPIAYLLGCGFVPVRKPGKLPHNKISASYSLEYGMDTLEMHDDAIMPGEKILVVDDLLATGGTSKAVGEMVENLKGHIVGFLFLIELEELSGRELLKNYDVKSIIKY